MSASLHDTERERGNYWRRRALDGEARIAELEAALVESNKNTLTPKQQGEIAARALFPLRAVTKGKSAN